MFARRRWGSTSLRYFQFSRPFPISIALNFLPACTRHAPLYNICTNHWLLTINMREPEMRARARFFILLLVSFSALFLFFAVCFVQLTSCKTRDRWAVIEESLLELLQSRPSTTTEPACDAHKDIDKQPYKSWNQSVVTLIEPEIPRNCSALFLGDEEEIDKVTEAKKSWKSAAYNQKFKELYIDSKDCEEIRTEFEGNFYVSDEELSFPLAFSMTVHDEAQQIIRFLKTIYRRHNVYCIHYDQKSNRAFRAIFNTLAKCLENVIIPRKTVSVVYGCYPILEAQLSCMSDLLEVRNKFPWKYTTTLCGKEIPLRTNREMVTLLQKMDGDSVLRAHEFLPGEYSSKMHKMVIKDDMCKRTWTTHNKPVPYRLKLLKSMAYFSLTPEFTNFIVNSPEAKALYNFVKPIKGPEEVYYGTLLNHWLTNGKQTVPIYQTVPNLVYSLV